MTVDDLTVGDEVELVIDTLYPRTARLPGVEVAPGRPIDAGAGTGSHGKEA